MYYCYLLYSKTRDSYYVGYTGDSLQERIRRHNTNHKGYTGKASDWAVVYYEEFEVKQEAMVREKEIKGKKSGTFLHIITYVKRWLKAPIQLEDGTFIQNTEKGTPQRGVISPVLVNIFLHLVLDKWMEKHFADCPFERYSDDIIIHVKNEHYARKVLNAVTKRMAECKLEVNPEKTKLVYCGRQGRRNRKREVRDCQFDFLGFTFRPGKLLTKEGNLMYGFSPSISRKSMNWIVETMRKLKFHRWVRMDIF